MPSQDELRSTPTWNENTDSWSPSGGSVSLLGPFTVTFETPGFINPDDNGIDTLAIPAGTLLLDVIPLATADWVGAVPHDQLVAAVLESPSGSGPTFAQFSLDAEPGSNVSVALSAHDIMDAAFQGSPPASLAEAVDWGSQKKPVLAVVDCHIVLAAFPAGAITGGSLDLYALVVAT